MFTYCTIYQKFYKNKKFKKAKDLASLLSKTPDVLVNDRCRHLDDPHKLFTDMLDSLTIAQLDKCLLSVSIPLGSIRGNT